MTGDERRTTYRVHVLVEVEDVVDVWASSEQEARELAKREPGVVAVQFVENPAEAADCGLPD